MRGSIAVALSLGLAVAVSGTASGRGGPFDDRPDTEAPPKPASEAVSFATADGVVIAGTFWPAGTADGPALVLVPQEGTTAAGFEPLAPALVEHRIAALAIDLRGPGSARPPSAKAAPPIPPEGSAELHATQHEDVLAAIRFLVETKKRDAKRIGVIGAGIGGAVALDAARREGSGVHALMLFTPSLTYPGLPSEEHAKALPGAVHVNILAAVADMDRGARRLLYTWEYMRNPPPFTPGKKRETARRGVIPHIRALVDPSASGMRILGRVPHIESWIAAWFAKLSGSYPRAISFDGAVDVVGDYGDPAWKEGTPLPSGLGVTGRALRWGRRVMVGAEVPDSCLHARVRVVLRRGERQLDIGALIDIPSGDLQASPFTLRKDAAPRPSIPIAALALEGQEGYRGVAPVKPSFEVEMYFPEIEGDGPYECRASLVVETSGGVLHTGAGVDPENIATWAVVPDSLAQ